MCSSDLNDLNLRDAGKAVLRGKFRAIQANLRKEKEKKEKEDGRKRKERRKRKR